MGHPGQHLSALHQAWVVFVEVLPVSSAVILSHAHTYVHTHSQQAPASMHGPPASASHSCSRQANKEICYTSIVKIHRHIILNQRRSIIILFSINGDTVMYLTAANTIHRTGDSVQPRSDAVVSAGIAAQTGESPSSIMHSSAALVSLDVGACAAAARVSPAPAAVHAV